MLAAAAFTGFPAARNVECRSSADGSSSAGAPVPPAAQAVTASGGGGGGSRSSQEGGAHQQPWQLAAYYTKKLERRTGGWLCMRCILGCARVVQGRKLCT